MTLAEYISAAKTAPIPAPRLLRTVETVTALTDEGLAVIRQDLKAARHLADNASRLAKKLDDAPSVGRAARLAGHVHLLAGRAKRAVPRYQQAREAFASSPEERAATAVAMLQALAYTGQYEQAFFIAREALAYFQESGDTFRAARVEANLANALHRLDRLAEAKAHYESARAVLAEAGAIADLTIVTRNYGVCLMGLLDFESAEKMYAEARVVFEVAEQHSLIFEIDLNRAYLLGRQGQLQSALQLYRHLRLNLPSEMGFELGHCFLDQADFMLEFGLWTDAQDAATQASNVFQTLGARFETGKAKLIEGIALIRRDDLARGEISLKEARKLLSREPNANWRSLLHSGFAELLKGQGRGRRAYREWQLAESAGPAPERLPHIQSELAEQALELGDLTTFERLPREPFLLAKYHRIQKNAEEAKAHAREGLQAYDQNRTKLGASRLRQATTQAQSLRLREALRTFTEPSQRLEVVVRLKNQALAELIWSPEALPQVTSEHELREARNLTDGSVPQIQLPRLEQNQRFVELFADQGDLLAFVLDSDSVVEHNLGPISKFERLARLLRFQLGRDRRAGGEGAIQVLADLHEALLPIYADQTQLIIGRETPLRSVPFHAVFPDSRVTYAPSASVYAALSARKWGGTNAVVCGSGDDKAPLIDLEVERVATLLGTSPIPASDLLEHARSARWIHLAAHGIVKEDQPLLSAMRLGERDLTVLDVASLKLQAKLVTLSGCSTGISNLGDHLDSEGFIEAFLVSGANTVLASLWDVSDEATSFFMAEFYGDLPGGLFAAYEIAVRHTKDRYPHPADWAPFALFGRPIGKNL